MEELADAQRTDPIIHWFIETVARPRSRGQHPRVRATPDMHEEAKIMLQQKNLFTLTSGPEFGNQEVLVYREQRIAVAPRFRQELIRTAHTMAHLGLNSTRSQLAKFFY